MLELLPNELLCRIFDLLPKQSLGKMLVASAGNHRIADILVGYCHREIRDEIAQDPQWVTKWLSRDHQVLMETKWYPKLEQVLMSSSDKITQPETQDFEFFKKSPIDKMEVFGDKVVISCQITRQWIFYSARTGDCIQTIDFPKKSISPSDRKTIWKCENSLMLPNLELKLVRMDLSTLETTTKCLSQEIPYDFECTISASNDKTAIFVGNRHATSTAMICLWSLKRSTMNYLDIGTTEVHFIDINNNFMVVGQETADEGIVTCSKISFYHDQPSSQDVFQMGANYWCDSELKTLPTLERVYKTYLNDTKFLAVFHKWNGLSILDLTNDTTIFSIRTERIHKMSPQWMGKRLYWGLKKEKDCWREKRENLEELRHLGMLDWDWDMGFSMTNDHKYGHRPEYCKDRRYSCTWQYIDLDGINQAAKDINLLTLDYSDQVFFTPSCIWQLSQAHHQKRARPSLKKYDLLDLTNIFQ